MSQTIVRCAACGAKNRVPLERKDEAPKCGKCGVTLDVKIDEAPVDVTDHTFKNDVLGYPGLVLLDCWAPWCGPCRQVAPVLETLAKDYKGQVKITKINMDENPGISQKYEIKSIPTMLFFKDGKQVHSMVGAHPKSSIETQIKSFI